MSQQISESQHMETEELNELPCATQPTTSFEDAIFDEEDIDNYDESSEYFEDETEEDGAFETRDFSQNQVQLALSWTLMNHLRYLARSEGIPLEDLLVELVSEGVTKRAFETHNRPAPSHLMTRTGYVHHTDPQTGNMSQPQLSHHMSNNRNDFQNRKNGHTSSRGNYANPQYKNQNSRYPQSNNGGFNHRGNQQGNSNGSFQNFGKKNRNYNQGFEQGQQQGNYKNYKKQSP